jgi:hypothetical protein
MNKRGTLLVLLFLYLLVPARIVFADTGPKPTMEFTFTGEAVTVVSGVLYECDQYDCSDAAPLEEVGPQGFLVKQIVAVRLAMALPIFTKSGSNFQMEKRA